MFAVIGPTAPARPPVQSSPALYRPDDGAIVFAGERIDGLTPDAVCPRGLARTFQIVRPFAR